MASSLIASSNARNFNSFNEFISSPELHLSDLFSVLQGRAVGVQVSTWGTLLVTVASFEDSVDITRIAQRIKESAEDPNLSDGDSRAGIGCVSKLRSWYTESDAQINDGSCLTKICFYARYAFDWILGFFIRDTAIDLKEAIMNGIEQKFERKIPHVRICQEFAVSFTADANWRPYEPARHIRWEDNSVIEGNVELCLRLMDTMTYPDRKAVVFAKILTSGRVREANARQFYNALSEQQQGELKQKICEINGQSTVFEGRDHGRDFADYMIREHILSPIVQQAAINYARSLLPDRIPNV